MNLQVRKYPLCGGSSVEVVRFFEKEASTGAEIYFAIVEMNGEYPERGKEAVNRNRDELFYLLEGTAEVTVNGSTTTLGKGGTAMALNGDRYTTNGKGRMLVFVRDSDGGKSEIVEVIGN